MSCPDLIRASMPDQARALPNLGMDARIKSGHDGKENADGIRGNSRSATTVIRSEEHTSELQSLMRISYAVFCLKKKTLQITTQKYQQNSKNTPIDTAAIE